MQCTRCGQENIPGAANCAHCGAQLAEWQVLPKIGAGASYKIAWTMMWKHFWMLLLILIIYTAISCVPSVLNLGIMPSTENIPEFGKMITLSIVITVIAILYFILVTCPVLTGLMYAYMKAARNEPPEIEDMFKVFRNYWHVVLAVILTNLICLIGLILLIFPGIILACKLAFVPYLLLDKKMKAMDAIKESWRMTRGHGWKVFWIGVLAIPVCLAGFICLGVGIIIASIWVYMAYASLYYAVDSSQQASLS